MKISGSADLRAPREAVWHAFTDPAVLVRTIPGCERLVEIGPDAYEMTLLTGVAAIKGTFAGDVRVSRHEPDSLVMTATGAGAPGTIQADVTMTLVEALGGGTRLDYVAEAVVGGTLGGVGQRVLGAAARRTAGEFFGAIDDLLTGAAPALAPAAPTAAAPAARPAVTYEAPAAARRALPGGEFGQGLLVGAAIALAGAAVGGWAAGRRRS